MNWRPDSLLDGYQQLTLELPLALSAPGESEQDPLVATLVRRNQPTQARAMLYVHGWSDYFYQTHLADFVTGLGFDFYAIDLRRYGRSLGEGQLGGFITDLDEYGQEFDAALAVIRADHERVTLMAHSTGGLAASLWAGRRPGELDGVILNSPWLDLHGADALRPLLGQVVNTLSRQSPTRVFALPDSGTYLRSIHVDQDGEWNFDLGLKRHPSMVIRAGWLNAILQGHRRVAEGLTIDTPVLSMMSARSDFRREWDESLLGVDTVLDVEKLARASVKLGGHVTVVRVEGGLHDLVLSREDVRAHLFDEISRWVRAYLPS